MNLNNNASMHRTSNTILGPQAPEVKGSMAKQVQFDRWPISPVLLGRKALY